MRKFVRIKGEYFINNAQVLYNPIVVRWKDKQSDTNDISWWINYEKLLKLLFQDDWWAITICPALPNETMGELDIIHNRHIRPWSLSPDWQLHRGFSVRNKTQKLIGYTTKTFDTAIDKEHMMFIAKAKIKEIIKGEEDFLN